MQLTNTTCFAYEFCSSTRFLIDFCFQRRLYEYVLHAVCSPLRVTDTDVPSERLAAHVAKVFWNERENWEKKLYRILFDFVFQSYLILIQMNMTIYMYKQ